MAEEVESKEAQNASDNYPSYVPDTEDQAAIREVLTTLEKARGVLAKNYNYFNNRNLYDVIDDWTKRWNGYIPPMNPLIDQTQSQIFVNFTRNAVISYLSKVALTPMQPKIKAVNKKTGLPDKQFASICKDLNQYSLERENHEAKFLQAALECVTKGTVIVYEGYAKNKQKTKIPDSFDAMTGKVKYTEGERIVYDDCFQQVVPLEDFYITNAFQPDVQKQPKVIWKSLTTHTEASAEFSHYPSFKYVKPGTFVSAQDMTSFYRETLLSDLGKDQVEVVRYYCRKDNRHIVMLNGVILYDGPIPFKDGRYPFAKGINEPFANDFFWGNGHPGKYMGEQDLINTFINMMADKTFGSLLPYGLSSDLDDLIEDDILLPNKIRKVGDISKWKFDSLPGVNAGEQSMFQTVMGMAKESAGVGAGDSYSPKGGKLQARQILLKQQEQMQKMSFNMNFLEDLERDRTDLRVAHILQFYSIPKIEKITAKNGREVKKLVYRDINLNDADLSDGRQGARKIRIIGGEYTNPDQRQKIADELSMDETIGELKGVPTEALAVSADTFYDYNLEFTIIKNSSFERNQALDQASRMEFANWRLSLAQVAPLDIPELVKWVEESFDVPSEQFERTDQMGGLQTLPGAPQSQLSGQSGGLIQQVAQGAGQPTPSQPIV